MSTFGLELETDFTGARTPLNHWTCIDGSPLQHNVCTMLPDQRCVHFLGKCHKNNEEKFHKVAENVLKMA